MVDQPQQVPHALQTERAGVGGRSHPFVIDATIEKIERRHGREFFSLEP
jgi:hypothetical protein